MAAHRQSFDGVERRGLMFVLSSPSGAGKTTLSRLLIEQVQGLILSVSATTRPMRPGEVADSDYRFVDKATFATMVERDELLEWARWFENGTGTPGAPLRRRCHPAATCCSISTGKARSNCERRH